MSQSRAATRTVARTEPIFDDDAVARLRLALSRINRTIDRQVNKDDLTRTQFSVLAIVANRQPIGLADIAALEGLNPTMLSRIVGKLETLGLIERQSDPADRRSVFVTLTARGRTLHQRVRRDRTRFVGQKLAELSEPDATVLLAALPALEALAGVGFELPTRTPGARTGAQL